MLKKKMLRDIKQNLSQFITIFLMVLNTIKQIENVKNAESKLVVNGVLEENNDVTLQLSFIESNEISKFYIIEGNAFDVNKKGIWLDDFFAKENNLKIGETLKIRYDVKDESQLYPDHKTFGFAYLSANELEEYTKYNYIIIDVDVKENVNGIFWIILIYCYAFCYNNNDKSCEKTKNSNWNIKSNRF